MPIPSAHKLHILSPATAAASLYVNAAPELVGEGAITMMILKAYLTSLLHL